MMLAWGFLNWKTIEKHLKKTIYLPGLSVRDHQLEKSEPRGYGNTNTVSIYSSENFYAKFISFNLKTRLIGSERTIFRNKPGKETY